MANKPTLTPEQLRQLLRYDPDTGGLYWLPRAASWAPDGMRISPEVWAKKWNTRFPGKLATHTDTGNGYLKVSLFNRTSFAHRLAWSIYYGHEPTAQIDHINRDRTDNRASNLRIADHHQNQHNRGAVLFVLGKATTSKYCGVYQQRGSGSWIARIRSFSADKGSTTLHIGSFRCETAAAIAYDRAAIRLHGEFAKTNII